MLLLVLPCLLHGQDHMQKKIDPYGNVYYEDVESVEARPSADDPSQLISERGIVVSLIPLVMKLIENFTRPEDYEPKKWSGVVEDKLKMVARLNRKYKRGKYTECQYQRLTAIIFDMPQPNCNPWE